MNRLTGKTALITGGTTGIGLATAQQFAAEGAQVIVTGRNPDTLAAASTALPDADVRASDAGSLTDIEALTKHIQATYGKLDIVFLNAGIAQFAPLGQVSEAFFDQMMDVNFKGPFFTLQALLPMLSEGASVILNTSVNAHRAPESGAVYGASKAALLSLGRYFSHAESFLAKRIRINSVSPGPISTPIYQKLGLPQEVMEGFGAQMQEVTALKRFGQDREIANVATFLASDEASYVTGAELVADGGYLTQF